MTGWTGKRAKVETRKKKEKRKEKKKRMDQIKKDRKIKISTKKDEKGRGEYGKGQRSSAGPYFCEVSLFNAQ